MADDTFTKADIDKAVKDAVSAVKDELAAAHAEDIQGLKDKNSDLLSKLRKASGVSPEDLAAVEAERDRLAGEVTDLNKQVKTLTTERDKAVERADSSEKAGQSFAREAVISGAIAKGNVVADLVEAYTAMVDKKAVTEMKDGKWQTTIDGKSADEWVAEHLASDAGKHFKAAMANGGGGAQGGKGGGGQGGKAKPAAEIDAMAPKERAAFFADGGTYAQPQAA